MAEFIQRSQAAKTTLATSERRLCRRLLLPRTTYRRWRQRVCHGLAVIRPTGPKKALPLPLEELKAQVRQLPHGPKRTGGVSVVYQRYAACISRRGLRSLVSEARAEHHQAMRQSLQHICWNHSNLAWATDAAEYRPDREGRKLRFVAAQDLRSRFRFAPFCALALSGAAIAGYREQLFQQFGPPLLLKRDNGSIFNNTEVDAVLSRWQVLPLNSPAYYPRYNGAMERGIREVKERLPDYLPVPPAWNLQQVTPTLASLCLQQNAELRRVLEGRSACDTFYGSDRRRFGQRERCAAFESIRAEAEARLKEMENANRRDYHALWRKATVHWLVCQNLITVSANANEQSVTPFS